ncbi:MAG: ArsA family ATPase [Actinomycetes bacterium]
MRVLLFTGKGGVGKTTVAAATAAHAASQGRKTLVISTDAAHSLGDAFGVDTTSSRGEPVEVDTGLAVQQVDTQRRFEQTWREVQSWLVSVLDAVGVDPLEAEELTVIPGADEVLALLEVRRQVESGVYEVVVVDCAPTAETLRLLALPDAFSWYVERVFPIERRVVRTLRPMLNRVSRVPMPQDRVFDAVERLSRELAEVRHVLTDPASASVRLVLTPEAVVVAEARRTLTSLSLYGYRVDGVIANRVFPEAGGDAWRSGWVASQSRQLAEVQSSFGPLPLWLAPYLGHEPVGVAALSAVAQELYADASTDPLAPPAGPELIDVERTGDEFVLSLALPLADKRAVDLVRKGDELVITVGSHRRVLALPSALRRCTVVGAALNDGRLRVRFEPDPALWMTP